MNRQEVSIRNKLNTLCDEIDKLINRRVEDFDLRGTPAITIRNEDEREQIMNRLRSIEAKLIWHNNMIQQHTKRHLSTAARVAQATMRGEYDV